MGTRITVNTISLTHTHTHTLFPLDLILKTSFIAVSMAILGGYTGLYVLYSISSAIGGKKKEPESEKASAPSSSSSSSSEGIPDVESPEFVTFLESDALEKLLESEEALKTLTE